MIIKYFTALLIAVALSGCGALGLQPTWGELWGDDPNARTDRIDTRITVIQTTQGKVADQCPNSPRSRVLACTSDGTIYIQGDGLTTTMKLHVQFVGTYRDLDKACGFNSTACYRNTTLYTYPYNTKGGKSAYRMGVIGDLLADAMQLDIGLNRREQLGHEAMSHVFGLGHPDVFEWSVNR